MENEQFEWCNSKIHGQLESLRVYYFYDGIPINFSAKNEKGEFFWCYSMGQDKNSGAEKYILVPVSCDNLARFEAGKISYLDMLTKQQIKNTLLYWHLDDSFEEHQINANEMPFLLPERNIYYVDKGN